METPAVIKKPLRKLRADVYHTYSSADYLNDSVKKTPRDVFAVPEDVPDNETTKRAMVWRNDGEVGMSSLALWLHLLDARHPESGKIHASSHPYDWDDFDRCVKVIEAVPEWKDRLFVMKAVSPKWSNIIDKWDTLIELRQAGKLQDVTNLLRDCYRQA